MKTSKYNRIGMFLLNMLLLGGIIVGQFEILEVRSVISIFFVPAFVISAALFPLKYSRKISETKEKT